MSSLSDLLKHPSTNAPDGAPQAAADTSKASRIVPKRLLLGGAAGVLALGMAGLLISRLHASAVTSKPTPAALMTPLKPTGKPAATHTVAGAAPVAQAAASGAPAQGLVAVVSSTQAASAAPAVAPTAAAAVAPATSADINAARNLFLQASRNAAQITSMSQVAPRIFAVAYAVGNKSGQAWVDLPAKVVFVGQAVSADGQVLSPANVVLAVGAVAPAPTPKAAKQDDADISAAQMAVLTDPRSGFWQQTPRTPVNHAIWAFVDPDSKNSMSFFKSVQPLVAARQLRVNWILVGVHDRESSVRAAWIMAQVGQVHQLTKNYANFDVRNERGSAPVDKRSTEMGMRILQNNALQSNLGDLQLPTVLACTQQGGVRTLFNPSIDDILKVYAPCGPKVMQAIQLAAR
jgi:hypothetical protein